MSYSYAKFKENPCVGTYVSTPFVKELILGSIGLGLQMGKFCKISTELLPLIYVENWIMCSILCILADFWLTLYMS